MLARLSITHVRLWPAVSLLVILFLISIAIIYRMRNKESIHLAHRQRGLELNQLKCAWINIVNRIDSKHYRIKDIKCIIEDITSEEGDAGWISSPSDGSKYQINLSTEKWISVEKHPDEIAIFCPLGIRIGKNTVYAAITFRGEGRMLEHPPEWININQ